MTKSIAEALDADDNWRPRLLASTINVLPMLLGLLTDIHEDVGRLRGALEQLAAARVDRVVVIGDVFEMGEHIEDTCRLLADVQAVGVWGNHDFGLCRDVDPRTRATYPAAVVRYMSSLSPRLDVDGCLFTHVEPWLNAECLEDLWYFDGPPDAQWKLDRIFKATQQRILFAGHYHRWLAAQPGGVIPWNGRTPLELRDGRWFVVVGAVCDGRCALYDTKSALLTPINGL